MDIGHAHHPFKEQLHAASGAVLIDKGHTEGVTAMFRRGRPVAEGVLEFDKAGAMQRLQDLMADLSKRKPAPLAFTGDEGRKDWRQHVRRR
jgi:hypothetical protein